MKLLIDSANVAKIEAYLQYLPIEGITSNPSILKKEGKIDVVRHMKLIRERIGNQKSLHIQVIANDFEGIIRDASRILDSVDDQVYIKIPVNQAGMQAIKYLKEQKVNITATAIYSSIQAIMAKEAGADFLAPYVNRMENLNTNPYEVIESVSRNIEMTQSSTQILAASFKNIDQVLKANMSGASHVTVGTDIIDSFFQDKNIQGAIDAFQSDWQEIHGRLNF